MYQYNFDWISLFFGGKRKGGGGRGEVTYLGLRDFLVGLEEGVLLEREEALLPEDLLGDSRVLVDPGHQCLQGVEVLLRPDVPAHQQPKVLPVEVALEVVQNPRLLQVGRAGGS